MILNDEKILEMLRQTNLIGEENNYFTGTILPTLTGYALFGAFASITRDFSGYIVNSTEKGIGIIPMSNMTGKPLTEHSFLIPNENIKEVKIEKGGLFFYKKISIINLNNEAITFKITKNVLPIKNYKTNVANFINKYSN